MAEPYSIYDALADRASVSRPSFPGYLSTKVPQLASHNVPVSAEFPVACPDINPLRLGSYGLDGYSSAGVHPEPVIGGVMPGASGKGNPSPLQDPNLLTQRGDASLCAIGGAMVGASQEVYPSSLEDPGLLSQRGDASVCVTAGIPEVINDRPGSLRSADGPSVPKGESNILFVDGLPTDCTRREVGHLFRPFIGYKEIKVVHREARNSGDRATVLCFIEFSDAKCAATAMEALQGYKFDDKKPDAPTLKIKFAHFPFQLPPDRDGQWSGIPR